MEISSIQCPSKNAAFFQSSETLVKHKSLENEISSLNSAAAEQSGSCIARFFNAIWNFVQNFFCCRGTKDSETEDSGSIESGSSILKLTENEQILRAENKVLRNLIMGVMEDDAVVPTQASKLLISLTVHGNQKISSFVAKQMDIFNIRLIQQSCAEHLAEIHEYHPSVNFSVDVVLIQFNEANWVRTIKRSASYKNEQDLGTAIVGSGNTYVPITTRFDRINFLESINSILKTDLLYEQFYDGECEPALNSNPKMEAEARRMNQLLKDGFS